MAGHLITNSTRAGHGGHMLGKTGPKGHDLPASDAHLQSGAYIPRAVLQSVPQNRQNTTSSGGADEPSEELGDYGKVDKDKD